MALDWKSGLNLSSYKLYLTALKKRAVAEKVTSLFSPLKVKDFFSGVTNKDKNNPAETEK